MHLYALVGRQPSHRANWHGAGCTSRAKKSPAEENHQPRQGTPCKMHIQKLILYNTYAVYMFSSCQSSFSPIFRLIHS